MKKRTVINKGVQRLGHISKIVLICFLTGIHPLIANVYGQDEKLNLIFENTELKSVLKEIKIQTQFDFVYNAQEVNANHKVTLHLENVDIKTALKACFEKLDVDFVIQDKIIILQKRKGEATASPQQREIKGKVVDTGKNPLPGVTVLIKGSTIGTATDMEGRFSLKVPAIEGSELIFSFIGMKPQIYKIKDDAEIRIIMEDDVAALDEVIVTGMEVIKKDRMTGSASVVTAKDLKIQGITSIDQILEGMVAGLNSTTLSGAPGSRAKISIRGENNLSGHTEPLWIIDGLPLMSGVPENNTGDYAGTIMQDGVGNIMPEDIESITILKDASAAAIYGAKAANGVIVITTKKGFRSKTQFNYSGNYSISIAPNMNLDFMNSAEKLQYETAIMDNFGLSFAQKAGRGGFLYKQMYEGYITPEQYRNKISELGSKNTDWFKTLFRTAQSHSHNLSLRGGSEEMTYYTSINFQQKQGILLPNKYSNAGALVKLDYRPIKNLILALDFSANIRKSQDHASAVDPFNYAVFANPYEQPYNANGNYASDLSYLGNNYTEQTTTGYKYDKFNILREMNETKKTQDGLDASLTFNIRYEIIPGLALESVVRKGISYNTETIEIGTNTYTSYIQESFARQVFKGQDVLPGEYNNGELSEKSGKNFNWSIRNQIDYSFAIKDAHLFSVLVANEVTSRKFNNFGYTSPVYYGDYRITGVPSFDNNVKYEDLRSAIGNMFNTSDGQDRTVSFLGSLRYGYKDRYVVNFNYRADGADAIGQSNRFTPLWSLGARYNLHQESFFKNDIVSELSVRGSYGYTGNIDRTAYPFSTISLGANSYEGNRYVTNFTYPNPSVSWEKKLDRNLGLDVSFLKNRINFTADYYFNRTEDVLEDLVLPASTGRTFVRANGGTVENKGIELYLNIRWINKPNFTFSTSVNASRNKNVILKSQYTYDSYAKAIASSTVKGGVVNIIGQETGSVYGWKVAGVDPASGNPMYSLTQEGKRDYAKFVDGWDQLSQKKQNNYKANGIGTSFDGIPNSISYMRGEGMQPDFVKSSMQYLGRSNPKYVGGFNTYIRYKSIEFSTQWTFKTGHIIPVFNDLNNAPNNNAASNSLAPYSSDLDVSGTNRQRKHLAFWQTPGDRTDVPQYVASGNDYWAGLHTSEKYEKGDYLRLTNLSVSYRLPADIINKFGMKNMSLAFNARNLLTFTKYSGLDVGSGGAFTYPISKEFNIKLIVGF